MPRAKRGVNKPQAAALAGDRQVAVAYVRVSTDEQQLGPEAQSRSITAWAQKNGTYIAAWTRDTMSGESELSERPGLQEAMKTISRLKAGVLVIAENGRLSRHPVIAWGMHVSLGRLGATVVSVDGVNNDGSPTSEFFWFVMMCVYWLELRLIRERIKSALGAKKAMGKVYGSLPYGSKSDEDGNIVDDEDEQRVVRRIVGMRKSGVSLRAIANKLESDGIRSRSGHVMGPSQIARISNGKEGKK